MTFSENHSLALLTPLGQIVSYYILVTTLSIFNVYKRQKFYIFIFKPFLVGNKYI